MTPKQVAQKCVDICRGIDDFGEWGQAAHACAVAIQDFAATLSETPNDTAAPRVSDTPGNVASVAAAGVSNGQSHAWIPVSERLPEPETISKRTASFVPVLFYVNAEDEQAVCAGRYYPAVKRGQWQSLQGNPYRMEEVTHWMPLPASPATGGEG